MYIILLIQFSLTLPASLPTNNTYFKQLYSEHFSLTKYFHIIILTDNELVTPSTDFCNTYIAEIIRNKPVDVKIRRLNQVDINYDEKFQQFLNDIFIVENKTTLELPEIVQKQTKQKLNEARYYDTDSNIIITHSLETLEIFLNGSFKLGNHRRLHVFYVLNGSPSTDVIKQVLLNVWIKFHILNAVVHFMAIPDRVYVYNPFHKTPKSWGIINMYRTSSEGSIINELNNLQEYPLKVKIFKRAPTALEEMPQMLKTNPIYADLYQYTNFTGVDGCLLAELAKQLNFTARIWHKNQISFGKITDDGWITGSLGYIVYDLVDLAANGVFMNEDRTLDYEFTHYYLYDPIGIIAPKSERIPQGLAIVKCFHWKTWIALFCCCASFFVVWRWTSSTSYDLVELILVFAYAPLNLFGHGNNLILSNYIIFNSLIIWIFQGTLIQSFSSEFYYPDIDTLEQLDASNLKISTSLPVFNYENDSRLITSLRDKVIHNKLSLNSAAFHRNVCALDRHRDSKLFVLLYMSKDGGSLLHVSRDFISSYYVAFMLPVGSPYLLKINHVIMYLLEGGIIDKWYDDIAFSIKASIMFKNPERNIIVKAFSLHALQSVFFIYLFGITVSCVVFVAENIYNVIKNQIKK